MLVACSAWVTLAFTVVPVSADGAFNAVVTWSVTLVISPFHVTSGEQTSFAHVS